MCRLCDKVRLSRSLRSNSRLSKSSNRSAMMVYPNRDLHIRPRKPNPTKVMRSWGNSAATAPEYGAQPWYTVGSNKPAMAHHEAKVAGSANGPVELCECGRAKRDLREYLQTSTLHGLRYIGEGRLSWLERIFWLVAFSMSLMCASFFILNIYDKWRQSPMIVSLNPEPMQLTSIPFPAITVCNVNQAKRSVANRIKATGSKLDKKLLEGICTVHNESALLDLDSSVDADWSYFKQFLISVTQPCSDMLAVCEWRSELRICETLFNTQLTDEGLCCTFNAVHRDNMFRNPRDLSDLNITFPFPAVDWTPEHGYPDDAPPDGFPWRPIGVGANLGLMLVLDANIDEYYCSTINSPGFKILLHNPTETPKIAEFGELFAAGGEARVAVLPRVYDSSPQLSSIAVAKRRCVFASEKKLVYYRTYTQKNCALEYEARLTVTKCNCSQYYMPKNRTTRICGKADAKCYLEVKMGMEDRLGLNGTPPVGDTCLPACSELSYSSRVSSTRLTDRIQVKPDMLDGKSISYFKDNMVVLHFYFEDTTFTRYTKGEIFGLTEFLSNTGGLLGLCMGFSVMSAVELLYFLSLRALCHARRRSPPPHHPFTQ